MNTETPAQRRTRLIEQFMIVAYADANVQFTIHELLKYAQELADAVIAATPQEPLPVEIAEAPIDVLRLSYCRIAKERDELEARIYKMTRLVEDILSCLTAVPTPDPKWIKDWSDKLNSMKDMERV